MNSSGRTCKNCGANIPEGARACPSCGRLSIDTEASRLGASPPKSETSSKLKTSTEDAGESEIRSQPSTAGDSAQEPPGEGPKPDSFYAVAPATPQPEGSGSSGGGSSGCSPCAILFIVIGWIVTLITVL
ncbi:MAG: zinc ribbon domain-containing protein [Candidatus Thorarchaeota archaeon]